MSLTYTDIRELRNRSDDYLRKLNAISDLEVMLNDLKKGNGEGGFVTIRVGAHRYQLSPNEYDAVAQLLNVCIDHLKERAEASRRVCEDILTQNDRSGADSVTSDEGLINSKKLSGYRTVFDKDRE